MKRSRWVLTILAVVAVGAPIDSWGRVFRPALLPVAPLDCNTCHTNGGGSSRNAFGLDVEARVSPNGQEAFWGPELAALDSDRDGVTNGQELGDPDGDGVRDFSIQVTAPGDATAFIQPPPLPPEEDPLPDVALGEVAVLFDGERLSSDGANGPFTPGAHEVTVVVGGPILGEVRDDDIVSENFNILIFPVELGDAATGIRLADNGLSITFTFDLNDDARFELVVADFPGRQDRGPIYRGGTRPLPTGGISGVVTTEGLGEIAGGRVLLLSAAGRDALTGAGDIEFFIRRRAILSEDSAFDFSFVPDGTYFLLAQVAVGAGTGDFDNEEIVADRRVGEAFDADGDGEPDPVVVSGGAIVEVAIAIGGTTVDGPARGRITRVLLDESTFCIPGRRFRILRRTEVEFPDGRRSSFEEAFRNGSLPGDVVVALDLENDVEGARAVVRVRLLGEGDLGEPGRRGTTGRLAVVDIEGGFLRFPDRCFLVTDATTIVEGDVSLALADLVPRDGVEITADPPGADGTLPVATLVTRIERAPEPLSVVSLTIDGQDILEDEANAPLTPGPLSATFTFNQPIPSRIDGDGEADLGVDIQFVPEVIGEPADLTLSDDGTAFTASVDVPENTTLQIAVGAPRLGGDRHQSFYIGTVELPTSSVGGTLAAPEDVVLPEATNGLVVLVTEQTLDTLTDDLAESDETALKAALAQIVDEVEELEPADEVEGPDPGIARSVREGVPDCGSDYGPGVRPPLRAGWHLFRGGVTERAHTEPRAAACRIPRSGRYRFAGTHCRGG